MDKLVVPGRRSALIVVDMQNRYCNDNQYIDLMAHSLSIFIDKFREFELPVFWACMDLPYFTDYQKKFFHVSPLPGDPIIWKNTRSAFFETDLDEQLKARSVKDLVVTGVYTFACVRDTVESALPNYDVFVPYDLIAELGQEVCSTLSQTKSNFGNVVHSSEIISALSGVNLEIIPLD